MTITVYESALARLSEVATEKSVSEINFHIPPDHPITEVLKRFGYEIHLDFYRNAGGMMRIINMASTFRKIKGELERRMKVHHFNSNFSLEIFTDIGSVNLNIKRGKVELHEEAGKKEKVSLTQGALSQLLVGYRKPREVLCETGNIKIEAKTKMFMEALHPEDEPYTWIADSF